MLSLIYTCKEGVKVTKHTHPKKKMKNLFMADIP